MLYEQLKEGGFIDDYGLVAPRSLSPDSIERKNKWDGSNNGLLYTSEAAIMAALNNDSFPWSEAVKACEVKTGLYQRSQTNNRDMNAMDDYTGLAAASAFIDGGLVAKQILSWGREHALCWNNLDPPMWDKNAFLGRMPSFIAHLKICAREPLSWWDQWAWAIGVYSATAAPEGETDPWLISDLLIKAAERTWTVSGPMSWAIGLRTRVLRKKWGSITEVAKVYFEKGHPLSLAWK
jgi:hypothetical protein